MRIEQLIKKLQTVADKHPGCTVRMETYDSSVDSASIVNDIANQDCYSERLNMLTLLGTGEKQEY